MRASNTIAGGSSICNQIGPPRLPWWTNCLLNRRKDEVRETVYIYYYLGTYICTPAEYSAQIDVCVFLLFAFHCEFLKRPISQSKHTKQTSAYASKNDANLALRECVLLVLTMQGISLFISSRSLDCNFSPMGHSGQALHRRAGRPPLGWLQSTTPLVVWFHVISLSSWART